VTEVWRIYSMTGDQLGRLVTHSGPSPQLTALTRRYGISTQRPRLFG